MLNNLLPYAALSLAGLLMIHPPALAGNETLFDFNAEEMKIARKLLFQGPADGAPAAGVGGG